LRQRSQVANREQLQRHKQARNAARRAAVCLKRDYGASRVVLFGSVAREERLGPRSDIDLAAWGIPAALYYEAVARVQEVVAPFEADLIRMERSPTSLRDHVEQEGVEL
jgi:predicted nucleotidyltransferase